MSYEQKSRLKAPAPVFATVLNGTDTSETADDFWCCCAIWRSNSEASASSGVLIDSKHILTVKHALDGIESGSRYMAGFIIPSSDRQTRELSHAHAVTLKAKADFWKSKDSEYDTLYLLELQESFAIPANLPSARFRSFPRLGTWGDLDRAKEVPSLVAVCGFGAGKLGGTYEPQPESPQTKRFGSNLLISQPADTPTFDRNHQIVVKDAPPEPEIDVSRADSGGPVFLIREHELILIGITERDNELATPSSTEAASKSFVAISIPAFVDWINRNRA